MPPSNSDRWRTDPNYIDLLNYIIERAENVESPMSINQLVKDFKEKSGSALTVNGLYSRIQNLRTIIHSFEHIDKKTKVKLLFALSCSVDSDFLKELNKDAVVKVDKKKQITHYKANDGSLEFRGDHSLSAKTKNAQNAESQSKRSLRSLIIDYCENKDDADAVPKNEDEKEIWNLIEFITEKCENADFPLNIQQLTRDFNEHFETSRSFSCIYGRIRTYCREIQTLEIMDAFTTVKQLFCLSATLDPEYLGKLRKDAVVEVDNLKRITKYTANDGHLTLHGDHSPSAKGKLAWIERKKENNTVKKRCISGDDKDEESEKENEYSEEDSDEYSSEKFGSEFNSDDENDVFYENEDLVKQSNKADDFDNETPVIIHSPSKISIDDNFDLDPPTERSHTPEEIEMREENDTGIIENKIINERYQRSKRKYSDLEEDSDSHPKDSDDENGDLERTQDFMELSNEADDSDEDTPVRSLASSEISIDNNFDETPVGNCLSAEMSIDNNLDFDPPTERSHATEETDMREGVDTNSGITGNSAVKEDLVEQSNNTDDFGSETPIRSRSLSEISIDDNLGFDPPTEKCHVSGETEMREIDEKDDSGITGNAEIKIRKLKMTPPISNRWTTDPEYNDLLNYLIQKAKDAKSPTNIQSLAEEFRKLIHCFEHIDEKTKVILFFALSASVNPEFLEELKKEAIVEVDEKEQITYYKANDGSNYFRLRKDAVVEVGNLKRITKHTANNNRLILNSDLSSSAKGDEYSDNASEKSFIEEFDNQFDLNNHNYHLDEPEVLMAQSYEVVDFDDDTPVFSPTYMSMDDYFDFDPPTKRSQRSDKIEMREDEENYSETTGNAEIKKRKLQMSKIFSKRCTTDPQYIELLNYLIQKVKDAKSPMRIQSLAKEFKKKSGTEQTMKCFDHRIRKVGIIIHSFEHIDKKTKVKLLFALSGSVNPEFLEELKKDAVVEVDDKQRIIQYKANNGCLELKGDHSQSAKISTARLDSKRSLRSLIINYFKGKNDVDAVPKNDEEKEMGNFIELINEKCKNAYSPLNISQLTKDFNKHFGTSRSFNCIENRVRAYCYEIQKTEFLDTQSKVKQLFYMSGTLDPDFLKELRKDAVVYVDNLNRITKYTANNGGLTLHGAHSVSAKRTLAWIEWRRNSISVENSWWRCNSGGGEGKESEIKNGYSEDDSDVQYFIEEIDLNNYDNYIDESEVLMEPSNGTVDFDDDIPVLSPTYMSMDDNFDFDPPTERFHQSDEIEMMEVYGEKNADRITGNTAVKTRKFKMAPPILNRWTTDPQIDSLRTMIHVYCYSLLFALSGFLDELEKNAFVKVDEKKQINYYTANDGSLELRRDYSHSAKTENAKLQSKRSLRSLIIDYCENKDDADAVPKNEDEKEIWNLIEFITKECVNADFPLNILQLARDFNKHFGISRSFACTYERIRTYCLEIQTLEIMNAFTTVKQLFCLSATLDSEYLGKLRKDAVVELDHLNRITKYIANNGRLTLHGYHSLPAKKISDSYFDPLTEKCHVSDEIKMREDEENDSGITGNAAVKTRKFKMTPPISNRLTTDPFFINLLTYLIEKTKDAKSPMNIEPLAKEFKEKSRAPQTVRCLTTRISRMRTHIWSFEHIDKKTKVKLLFALCVSVNPEILEELKKDAFVEVNYKQRIIYYKANDGSLELGDDRSVLAINSTALIEPKRSYRSMIKSYFEKKNDHNAVPDSEEEEDMWKLIEFITEKCGNVNTPLRISRLAKEFVEKFRTSMSSEIRYRINRYGQEIQRMEFIDTRSKIKQLFGLSAAVNSDYLEKLRTEALVDVDEKSRIVHYKANDGTLELGGDHDQSAKNRTAQGSIRLLVINYFKGKNDVDAVPKNDEEEEMGNLIEFITEKCENVDSPLSIRQLTKDFNKHFGTSRSSKCINKRVRAYCHEVQKTEFFDTQSKVKQLFYMGGTLDPDFLKELRKDAVVDVDDLNRITKYTANNGGLTLHGEHSLSAKLRLGWIEREKNSKLVENSWWRCNSGGGEGKESENEKECSEDDNDEYFIEEFDNEFDLNNYDNYLDEPGILIEPSNETVDFDDHIPVFSPTYMSMDDYFGFDPPTERSQRSDEIEMMGVYGEKNAYRITGNTAVKTRKFEALPRTSQTPKRKADASAKSSTSKRTKPLPEESMNEGEMDDNFSHDDPPRIELIPFRGPLGLSDGIVEKYEEESHFSLKSVLKSFKSLILSVDTLGLYQFLVELEMKILESGRKIEIPNKEVMVAMDFLILELTKHSAPESSEDSISLREILLMLRTIFLNTSFDGVDVILEILKKNIEELKAQDKKVPVSRVDSALSATLDIICT